MRTINRTIVGAFVFSSDDKVLLGLMAAGGAYDGLWVIPGGGVDEGETTLQALHREFMEEAGLDLSGYEAKRTDPTEKTDTREKTLAETGEQVVVNMRFVDYEVHIDKPASQLPVTPNDEFNRLAWTPVAELPRLKMSPVTQGFFKRRGYWRDR